MLTAKQNVILQTKQHQHPHKFHDLLILGTKFVEYLNDPRIVTREENAMGSWTVQ